MEALLQGSIWRKVVLKFIRSWRHQKHLLRSWRHQRFWRSLGAKDHQKLEDWKLQICVKCCFNHACHCRRIEAEATANSEEFERHWMLILWRTLEKDNSTKCTTISPLLCFVSAIVQELQLWLRWYSSILRMDLKLFLHRTIIKSGKRSLVIWSSFKRLFLMYWQPTTSLSHLHIKKWRPEELQNSHNNFTSAETLLKLFHFKVHLEFPNNFHILEF